MYSAPTPPAPTPGGQGLNTYDAPAGFIIGGTAFVSSSKMATQAVSFPNFSEVSYYNETEINAIIPPQSSKHGNNGNIPLPSALLLHRCITRRYNPARRDQSELRDRPRGSQRGQCDARYGDRDDHRHHAVAAEQVHGPRRGDLEPTHGPRGQRLRRHLRQRHQRRLRGGTPDVIMIERRPWGNGPGSPWGIAPSRGLSQMRRTVSPVDATAVRGSQLTYCA